MANVCRSRNTECIQLINIMIKRRIRPWLIGYIGRYQFTVSDTAGIGRIAGSFIASPVVSCGIDLGRTIINNRG